MELRSSGRKQDKLLSQITFSTLVKSLGSQSPLFLKASLISFFLDQTLVVLNSLKQLPPLQQKICFVLFFNVLGTMLSAKVSMVSKSTHTRFAFTKLILQGQYQLTVCHQLFLDFSGAPNFLLSERYLCFSEVVLLTRRWGQGKDFVSVPCCVEWCQVNWNN